MTRVNITHENARLSELIDRAPPGEEVVTSRCDAPVIHVVSEPSHDGRSLLDPSRRRVVLSSDFDAPVPGFQVLGD